MNEGRDLASMECVPCRGGVPPLDDVEIGRFLEDLGGEWTVVDGHHLEKTYRFKNFRDALDYVNRVGELAESVNHHPDIELGWGRVAVTLTTHAAGGLTDNDYILAAKLDRL